MNHGDSGQVHREPHAFLPPTPTEEDWSAFKSQLAHLSFSDPDPEIPASLLQVFLREEWPCLMAAESPTDWKRCVARSRNEIRPDTTPLFRNLQNHLVLKHLWDQATRSSTAEPDASRLKSIPDWMLAAGPMSFDRIPHRSLSDAGYTVESLLKHAAPQVVEIFQDLCRFAVAQSGLKLAWVGLFCESSRSLEIAAWRGETAGYLDGIRVSTQPDQLEGRGPMALAFRTGERQIIQAIFEDSRFQPWRERARRFGLASTLSLPIRIEGLTIGALGVYAGERDFFTKPVIEPFVQLVLATTHRLETVIQQLSFRRQFSAYRAEHALNEAIALRAPLDQLCENACRILAEFLELGLCYIVEAVTSSKTPLVRTTSGPARGFLEGIDFGLDPTHPNAGLSALAYAARQPIVIDHFEDDPRLAGWRERLSVHALKSGAGFPLYGGGKEPWGVLVLLAFDQSYFNAPLVAILEKIAHRLSLAIGEDLRRQKLFQMERFYLMLGEMGHALVGDPPLPLLLKKSCELISRTTNLPIVYITLIDPKTKSVHLEAFAGPESERIRNVPVTLDPDQPEGRGVTGVVFRSARPVIVNNLGEEHGIWLSEAERAASAAVAGFPLLVNGECSGVLVLGAQTQNFFDDELLGLLERAADILGTALSYSYEKIQRNRFEKLFRALSELHRLIARHPDPSLLYREIKRILSQVDGTVSNGILPAAEPTDTVAEGIEPHLAFPNGTVDFLVAPLQPFCQQMAAEAGRNRTPRFIRMAEDPEVPSGFKEACLTAGVREIGFFPILFRGRAFATLVLLSSEDGFFASDALIELCTQFTDAITLALTEYDRETELKKMALMDTLTGLPNRNLFFDRLDGALRQAERTQSMVGIVILDVDHFKEINDRFGHDAGDFLLTTQARRMESLMNDQSTVARLAGDEFGLILTGLNTEAGMTSLLERLRSALEAPVVYQKRLLQSTVSLGMTIYPQDSSLPRMLMRHADLALYRAKSRGRNAWALYEEDFEKHLQWQMTVRREFHKFLENGDIQLYLQPVIDLQNGSLESAEALVRWPGFSETQHGKTGWDWQATVGEDPQLLSKTGRYLLGVVGRELETLDRTGLRFPVSLNVDLHYFLSPDFEPDIQNFCNQYGSLARRLILELKPGALLSDWNRLPHCIERLKRQGIRVFLDNFGLWPVALEKLNRIHIQGIKIDRSLVLQLHNDPRALSLVAGALRSGEIGNFEVIAVGVERDNLAELFSVLGGRLAQGFFATPALESKALVEWSGHWSLPTRLIQSRACAEDGRLLPLWLSGPYHRWLREHITRALGSDDPDRDLVATLATSACSLVPWPSDLLSPPLRRLCTCHDELHKQLDGFIAAALEKQATRSLGKILIERMEEYEVELDKVLHSHRTPSPPRPRRRSPKASPAP